MSLRLKAAVIPSILSGIFTLLNSWSFFQNSSFYFTAACYLLAFGSLTLLGAGFLLFDRAHRRYWGTLIMLSSILAFLSIASVRSEHLLVSALIAFYLGTLGGALSIVLEGK